MLDYLSAFSPADFFTLANFLALFGGGLIGMLIGALPGLGASIALVMLLPFSYDMEPITGILLLLSAYQSANYGGSISSILMGIPGTPGSVATMLDGHPLAQANAPGKALAYSLTASTIGGLFGAGLLIFTANLMAKLSTKLGAPEYFIIAVAGVVVAVSLSSKDITKSLLSVALGLAISTIGIDVFTGSHRFTGGNYMLLEGVKLMSVLIGVFAIPEILTIISDNIGTTFASKGQGLKVRLTRKETKGILGSSLIGSVIGGIGGIIPGIGSVSGTWMAHSVSSKVCKSRFEIPFGKGNPDGIASAESANNAGVGGELIPLIIFGFPANPAPAIIMGAFIMHGITTGPSIFTDKPDLISMLFIGFGATSIVMYLLGRFLTPAFARLLLVPNRILVPVLLFLSVIGCYAAERTLFDIWMALFLGIIIFFLKIMDFSPAGFCLAFVMGPLIEENLRRSLMAYGSYSAFMLRPQFLIIFAILAVIFVLMLYIKRIDRSKTKPGQ